MSKKKTKNRFNNKGKKLEEKTMKNQDSYNNEMMETSEELGKKKSSKLYYLILIVILLGAAVYFGVQKYGNFFVVASVNGKMITRLSLWQRLEKQSGKQILDQMVSEVVLEKEAEAKGLKIADKDIDSKIKELEKQFKGKAGLDQVLSLQGMTLQDLKNQLKYNLIVEKLAPQVKVSEAEILEAYDKSPETYGEELTDEVKAQIKTSLIQQKRSQVVSDWFESIKKKAKINSYL